MSLDLPDNFVESVAGMLASGVPIRRIAAEYGMKAESLRSCIYRKGIADKLPPQVRGGRLALRNIVGEMRAADAVEYLLDLFEATQGFDDRDVFRVLAHGFTRSEAEMLLRLLPGRVVRRDALHRRRNASPGNSMDDPLGSTTLSVFISKVRKKIGKFDVGVIEKVWGTGYRFVRKPGAKFPWEVE